MVSFCVLRHNDTLGKLWHHFCPCSECHERLVMKQLMPCTAEPPNMSPSHIHIDTIHEPLPHGHHTSAPPQNGYPLHISSTKISFSLKTCLRVTCIYLYIHVSMCQSKLYSTIKNKNIYIYTHITKGSDEGYAELYIINFIQ